MRFLPVFGYLCTRQRWFSYDESFVDLEGAVQCARYSFRWVTRYGASGRWNLVVHASAIITNLTSNTFRGGKSERAGFWDVAKVVSCGSGRVS